MLPHRGQPTPWGQRCPFRNLLQASSVGKRAVNWLSFNMAERLAHPGASVNTRIIAPLTERRRKSEHNPMSAAALLDRLGRPGDIHLGSARPGRVARLPTGLAALDAALGGGLPRGRVTELAGAPSTGRTGLACAIAAAATRAGETIAWVDPADALEPEAAAAAGIALARLLWVRPREVSDAFRAAEILLGAGGFGLVVLDVDAPRAGAGGWPRLARAAERTRSTLLVVALRRAAGTFAALGLELGARRVRWSGGPGRLVLLEGIDACVTVARSRVGRPGQALVVRQACA